MASKSKEQRLQERCLDIWSLIVRTREDFTCQMCGSQAYSQAHHCIKTKGGGGRSKFDSRNGITLCFNCHIHKIHGQASQEWLIRYTQKVNALIPIEIQDDIIQIANQPFKKNMANLEIVKEELTSELATLQEIKEKYVSNLSAHN